MPHRSLNKSIFTILLLLAIQITSHSVNANTRSVELEISENTIITIRAFGDKGPRILWLPTEYGTRPAHETLLTSLADNNSEVWLSELHDSYFLPRGRKSYTKIPPDEIAELIRQSIPPDNRPFFIVTTGRAAALALSGINNWQLQTGGNAQFAGLIMLHPNLQSDTPKPGYSMHYLPVVDNTQLPIYIIQPKRSEKVWYLDRLVTRLHEAGSKVYTQIIEQASDGFHIRDDVSDEEKQLAKKLPVVISNAMRLLAKIDVSAKPKTKIDQGWQLSSIPEFLQPYPGTPQAPPLKSDDLNGKHHDLSEYRGKVVVVNFWATWCGPCVDEIPSLGRLQKAFSKQELIVLSIDIGETRKEVEKFLAEIPADFPVLLDPDGEMFKRWRVIGFPTTFVIDKEGLISLAYYGALEWDRAEVVEQLRSVVNSAE